MLRNTEVKISRSRFRPLFCAGLLLLLVPSLPAEDDPKPAASDEGEQKLRQKVSSLIQSIGREPATLERVDLVMVLIRYSRWGHSRLAMIERLVTDADFVQRMDAIYQKLQRRPATAEELIRQASSYHLVADDSAMLFAVRVGSPAGVNTTRTLRGTLVDAETKQSISGATVSTADAIARSDPSGAFVLKFAPVNTESIGFWTRVLIEADGHALAVYYSPKDAGDESGSHIFALAKDALIRGQVLSTDGKPIADVNVQTFILLQKNAILNPEDNRPNGTGSLDQN